MPDRTCEECATTFYQHRGRPARRCPDCRPADRYGASHRAAREALGDVTGTACARCGRPIGAGESWDLDHDEHGGYLGPSHASHNRSAGASKGNRLRAAAYRRMNGLPDPPQRATEALSRTEVPHQDDDAPIIGTFHLIDEE